MNAMEFLEKEQDTLREARSIVKSPKCNCIHFIYPSLSGVFIMQLPDDQRIPFTKWLYGQTTTTILGQRFAYATDYDRWYDAWSKGQTATVID